MKLGTTHFLRGVIFLLGLVVMALCVFVLPLGIIDADVGEYRPILIGMYVPAIPFFIALYQALKLLAYIDAGKAFSDLSIHALKVIKYCAVVISILFTVGMPYILYAAQEDDAPGVVLIGFVIVFASVVVATFATLLQKILHDALVIKSENDLTV